ncbi:MAG: glycosyl hydrolase family 18 protein [Actinomycetota bacterium]|nr:glycosyl hydrolase family 18 protein [Actinomycetota bacterium]
MPLSGSDQVFSQLNGPLRPHEVFGFAPYWTLAQEASFDVSGLSTIAYFGLDVAANGSLVTTGSGWSAFQSPALEDLIARAHRARTRVVLVAKTFDPAVLHALSADPSAANRLTAELAAAVVSKGMDGVNLDFEGPGAGDRVSFTTFLRGLAYQLHRVDRNWQVSLDTFASAALDSTGLIDVPALASSMDAFFVMAYDMNSSLTPTPTAPLSGQGWNDTQAMLSYLAVIPGAKVILGIPFYGYEWPTTTGTAGVPALGTGHPVTYGEIAAAGHAVQWDAAAAVAWTAYRDGSGQWWQAYFDDPQSVALKVQLADKLGLAGVGVWALGMDGGDRTMMSALLGRASPVKAIAPNVRTTPALLNVPSPPPVALSSSPPSRPTPPLTNSAPAAPAAVVGTAPSSPAPAPGTPAGPVTIPVRAPASASAPSLANQPPVAAGGQPPAPVATPVLNPAPTHIPVAAPRASPVPSPAASPAANPVPSPAASPAAIPRPSPPARLNPSPAAAAKPPQPIRLEAESLPLAAPPATTAQHRVQPGSRWSGGAQLVVAPTAVGQRLSLLLDEPAAGSYVLLVDPTLGPDYGTWQLEVDGQPVGGTFDAYSNQVESPASPTDVGRLSLPAGRHLLTLLVTGRDSRSTGHLAGIDFIALRPADDQS